MTNASDGYLQATQPWHSVPVLKNLALRGEAASKLQPRFLQSSLRPDQSSVPKFAVVVLQRPTNSFETLVRSFLSAFPHHGAHHRYHHLRPEGPRS